MTAIFSISRQLSCVGIVLVLGAGLPAIGAETAPFQPPPRSIADVTAILDQQKPDPAKAEANRKAADAQPAANLGGADLALFYFGRGLAAAELGRVQQRVGDMRMAVQLGTAARIDTSRMLQDLVYAENELGNGRSALQAALTRQAAIPSNVYGEMIGGHDSVASAYANVGDFAAADKELEAARSMLNAAPTMARGGWQARGAYWQAIDLSARARVDVARGQLSAAEASLRASIPKYEWSVTNYEQIIGVFDKSPAPKAFWENSLTTAIGTLARVLRSEGNTIEAELYARQALLDSLSRRGRDAPETAEVVVALAEILIDQSRYADAEKLGLAAVRVYEQLGAGPGSWALADALTVVGEAQALQSRWKEARASFDEIAAVAGGDDVGQERYLRANPTLALLDINIGQAAPAVDILRHYVDVETRLYGANAVATLTARGLLATALVAKGDGETARREFAAVVPGLIADNAADASSRGAREALQRRVILETYLALSAGGGPDLVAGAFQMADKVREGNVQRAIAAAASRTTSGDSGMADLVRRQQDAALEAESLTQTLASDLALPSDPGDAALIQKLRGDAERKRGEAAQLEAEIGRRYPDYAHLVNPQPASVTEAQRALRANEALLSVYIGQSKVYVWAVPKSGPVSFAVSPLSASDVAAAVATLRKSLAPSAAATGEIPAFDVGVAYKLYAGLLAPVKTAWQGATNLLVAANGPLGELPFGLLVTADTKVAPEGAGQPMFGRYRPVPWLIRQVAITQLPSVTSLTTLRANGGAKGARRPFIGFGDPWFTKAQQAEAVAQQGTQLVQQNAGSGGTLVAMRGAPLQLRSLPKTDGMSSVDLGALPRLPDTAEEVKEVAAALQADPSKDVYLGAQANEETVLTTKLDDRRVVMFATHGLVPGDLNGLTEPALALSSPAVANVKGDGLLTVSKILGLRLNADWVVLSACNTAAGNGAGAEAVSGLGLAFFYAGSHALLVSNWPVETTSARMITTDLFRREAATPGIARAEALRQAMLALIDGPGVVDPRTNKPAYTYAHPIFWAPFSVVGDGGAS